jgi:oligopeptide/dipeptide ABC transporter ATP-binding protein
VVDTLSATASACFSISHDLDVVEHMSHRVLVMYLGQVVEACSSEELYRAPLHPYTRVLLSSIPKLDPDERAVACDLPSGEVPALNPPSGCRFRTCCAHAIAVCATTRPQMRHPTRGHAVSCFLYDSEVPVHA